MELAVRVAAVESRLPLATGRARLGPVNGGLHRRRTVRATLSRLARHRLRRINQDPVANNAESDRQSLAVPKIKAVCVKYDRRGALRSDADPQPDAGEGTDLLAVAQSDLNQPDLAQSDAGATAAIGFDLGIAFSSAATDQRAGASPVDVDIAATHIAESADRPSIVRCIRGGLPTGQQVEQFGITGNDVPLVGLPDAREHHHDEFAGLVAEGFSHPKLSPRPTGRAGNAVGGLIRHSRFIPRAPALESALAPVLVDDSVGGLVT
jgi:hypothetical protein